MAQQSCAFTTRRFHQRVHTALWCRHQRVASSNLDGVSGGFPCVSQMGVSKNSGTPKSSILIGFSIINHPFWGTSIFGNTHIHILKAFLGKSNSYKVEAWGIFLWLIFQPPKFFVASLRNGWCIKFATWKHLNLPKIIDDKGSMHFM